MIEAEVTIRIYDTPEGRNGQQHGAHFSVTKEQADYLIELIRLANYGEPLVKDEVKQRGDGD